MDDIAEAWITSTRLEHLLDQQTLLQPFNTIVEATLIAAAHSIATRRSYQTAIGLFLQYLDRQYGEQLPTELAHQWRPFAQTTLEGKRTLWLLRPPVAVLRIVDARVLDGFGAWRRQEGDHDSTAAIRLYAVRTLLAVAYRDGILLAEQAQRLNIQVYRPRQRQIKQPVGRRLTGSEVRALRECVDLTTNKGKRDLAMLDAMLFLGLRREEVTELDLAEFRQDGGRWWVVLEGKGNKLRRLKVHDVFYHSLDEWLSTAKLMLGSSGAVFRSFDRGDHMTQNSIDASVIGRLVAHYGYKAGIAVARGPNQLSAHDLRRTCARNAYDNGASLLMVQAMLGHEDPKTTAHYIGAFESDEDTAVDYVRYG